MNDFTYRWLEPVLRGLRLYHRHQVHGLEHVPRSGRALIVINHSLATYDAMLLGHAIHKYTGRFVRGLADRLMFRMPLVRTLAADVGIQVGSPENGARLLDAGELVMVAPGGMREALRPSTEEFHVDWHDRLGFVRLAAETRTPVVLAACPMADRIYSVYGSALTRVAYERFRIPLPVARGLGPTALPRPVRLTHFIDRPLAPPRSTGKRALAKYHAKLVARMEELLTRHP
jgi:1-acyl-sn-glycerol-3-phosphate acyltransferase